MKYNIIHSLWSLFSLGEKKEKSGRAVFSVQVCVSSSFQKYHAVNLLESCLFMALTQAAFLIAELKMLLHLGMVSTMSVKSERERVRPTTKTPFLERYDVDPEITLSCQNIIATFYWVLIEGEWSSGSCAHSVIVVSPAVMVCAY